MTDELFEVIIAEIYEGETVTNVLQFQGVTWKQFYDFIYTDPSRELTYERAREARADKMVDDLTEIADNELDAAKARNRIDARKWVASKLKPRMYSDRIDINITKAIDINAALEAGLKRALPVHDPESIEDAQVIETKAITDNSLTDSVSVNQKDHDLKGRK